MKQTGGQGLPEQHPSEELTMTSPTIQKLLDLRRQEADLEEQIANLHTQRLDLLKAAGTELSAQYGLSIGDRIQSTDKRRKDPSAPIASFSVTVSDDGQTVALVAWVPGPRGGTRGITITDKTIQHLEVVKGAQ